MMGVPDGWVCDVPGLSRTQQLKLLGNGCVPQQVAYAVVSLLGNSAASDDVDQAKQGVMV